ncbi:winged helix-turn-helix transcriptional regulator [Nocardia sp. alder85J]|uniref:winged helix-turn-helix transcriptional regulator n=1 Tax=Nocardia sp. alder85J TaxID=2862949 RepID=UPI001CD5A160|nr:helix-turn-helix domain-containing protein [Nocardia sp. alder85J]MCX4098176.1 helix-turn-helix domain-containing protein [Nocardia sp. alder85J]
MEWTSVGLGDCPVVRALEVVGSRWTLLVIRELFNGVYRFEDIQQHLGVSTSVLSRRLAEMVDAGLADRRAYRAEGSRERFEYLPTTKSWDLYPVLVGLMQWGDRYLAGPDGPPVQLVDRESGRAVIAAVVPAGTRTCDPSEITVVPTAGEQVTSGRQ